MGEELKAVVRLNPNIAVFAIGAFFVVALGGMALGYEVELNALEGTLKLTRLDNNIEEQRIQ